VVTTSLWLLLLGYKRTRKYSFSSFNIAQLLCSFHNFTNNTDEEKTITQLMSIIEEFNKTTVIPNFSASLQFLISSTDNPHYYVDQNPSKEQQANGCIPSSNLLH
jgi:hypothetical protein